MLDGIRDESLRVLAFDGIPPHISHRLIGRNFQTWRSPQLHRSKHPCRLLKTYGIENEAQAAECLPGV